MVGLVGIVGGQSDFDRHQGTPGISVARGWRGQGLGRALMEGAIAEARSGPGFCRIELICVTWNTNAIALYESLGFTIEGAQAQGREIPRPAGGRNPDGAGVVAPLPFPGRRC